MVRRYTRSSHNRSKVVWKADLALQKRVRQLANYTDIDRPSIRVVKCVRSTGATTRAYARIWGLPSIWQIGLGLPPSYILEVVSEKFDRLTPRQQDEVLIHELAHIPKTFSGALLAHTHHGPGSFQAKLKKMITLYRQDQ